MREARDPRLAGVTITGVDITPDLLIAHVHFTVLGDAESESEALAGFQHAGGFLRTELAGRVQLRFVPELIFKVDRSAAYGRHIDELLDQIQSESEGSEESMDSADGAADAGKPDDGNGV
jgi:ribosome-binding factor A